MFRSSWVVIAAVGAAACTPASQKSSYEQCLAEPGAWRDGMSRSGGWDDRLGFGMGDWGQPYAYAERLRVTERVENCKHIVTFDDPGRTWTSRPYDGVENFYADPPGTHLAFVAYADRTYVTIDGEVSQPWRDVLWPPTFSRWGHHVAYLAKDEQGGALVIDGKVRLRAKGFVPKNFLLYEDGRVAAERLRDDGKVDVVLGDWESPPFDEICELSFKSSSDGRLAFIARSGNTHYAVVDLAPIAAPGVPDGCEVKFSDDGSRYGYTTTAHKRLRDGSDDAHHYAVIDGRVSPIGSSGTIERLTPQFAILGLYDTSYEHKLLVLEASTPAVAPTADDYTPPPGYASPGTKVRVQLGDSLGPGFDSVDMESFARNAGGQLVYVGLRGGTRIEVVDNVIPSSAPPVPEPPPPQPPALQVVKP